MIKLFHFPQKECPSYLRVQIISLMKQEWPQAFEGEEDLNWPDSPDTNPTSFLLVDNEKVISHVAVPFKLIEHKGQMYKAYGLSEVMTDPSYRNRGFGLRLLKEARLFIEKNHPDISIFTCKPSLVPFYTQGGWEHANHTCLVGGTRNQPFRSDELGLATMIRFISDKAQKNRLTFEGTDVYLELGERKLW